MGHLQGQYFSETILALYYIVEWSRFSLEKKTPSLYIIYGLLTWYVPQNMMCRFPGKLLQTCRCMDGCRIDWETDDYMSVQVWVWIFIFKAMSEKTKLVSKHFKKKKIILQKLRNSRKPKIKIINYVLHDFNFCQDKALSK